MACDFFISFTASDRPWAEWIAWHLQAANFKFVYQHWDFRPGQDFVERMHEGTSECARTIMILSQAYLKSEYAAAEWRPAFRRDPSGKQGILLPVRIEKCEVGGLLGGLSYIDLVDRDEKSAQKILLAGLQLNRVDDSIRQVFPKRKPEYPGTKAAGEVFPKKLTAADSNPVAHPPPESKRATTERGHLHSDLSPRLRALVKEPLHSYHLTLNSAGEPIWSYAVLHFEEGDRPGVLKSRVVHLPDSVSWTTKKLRHEYECEASIDHNNLVLRTQSPTATDEDIFTRIFPNENRYPFPLCGVGFISHTWNDNPASTISILADAEIVPGLSDGHCTSDAHVMQLLQSTWDKAAQRLHLSRLPHGVTMYPNWDRFQEMLGTIERRDTENIDLRIVTIAFTDMGLPEGRLMALARKGIRIKILLTDPKEGRALVRGRNKIRWRYDRTTLGSALNAIRSQALRLKECRETIAELKSSKHCTGDLDFALSDMFPYGFAAISHRFVILGIFLATGSYAEGPMIVIDSGAHSEFSETLKGEWDERWIDATGALVADGASTDNDGLSESDGQSDQIVSDIRLITGIEARVPDEATIWVAASDLSNVGDATSPFSEVVRSTVRRNAQRGVRYVYIFSSEWAGKSRLEHLQECFVENPGRLSLHIVPAERFLEFTLVPSHFISFAPFTSRQETYMQLPISQPEKGWVRLNGNDRLRINAKMKELMEQYPAY